MLFYDRITQIRVVLFFMCISHAGCIARGFKNFGCENLLAYLVALSQYGTRIGQPMVKHIEGDIWELRPLRNRIFFFYWKENKIVLLHYYIKKSQKMSNKEFEKAKRNLKEFLERNASI